MHVFKDSLDRSWSIAINVAVAKKLKSTLQIDLLNATDGQLVLDLAEDPVKLCDLLFVLVEEQAQSAALSSEDFGRGLAGDAIDRATTAFLEELVDFFPSGKRLILGKMLARAKSYQERAIARVAETLDSSEMGEKLDARIESLIEETMAAVGVSSTKPPGSSE